VITKTIMEERELVEPYVERILQYAGTKYPVYLVIDNVDQLESDDYQRRVFIEAQAAARKTGANVIMSLRDATYLRHRQTPSFDAFQVDSIYIDPPPVTPVLSRRFAYAKKVLEGRRATIRSEAGLKFQVENLGVFF